MPTKKAMISSTARDLPEHRKQAESACQRVGVFAQHMMENLTAEDADAVTVSLRLVDEADVYIGIFAYRYGYVPEKDNPEGISITEMEYRRAEERGIPRLVFFIHEDHPVKGSDVEKGAGAEKLEALKKRIGKERVASFFKSPEDLRGHLIQALTQLQKQWEDDTEEKAPHQFHYVHPLTAPPEPYIAHKYTLSQTTGLIGRQQELDSLTDWITGKGNLRNVSIFSVIAIGGMGKSALTWKWFNEIAPLEWPAIAGRFWWSFYESDAYFENFVIRALAYVSHRSIDDIKALPRPQREAELLDILDREPHLLVLDGLERILIAYARMDASRLVDDDYDKRTANYVAMRQGLTKAQQETFIDGHRLRKSADPRADQFLRKLRMVRASKILISSRLFPFALQLPTGQPMPYCAALPLDGLAAADSLALWRYFGCTGGRDVLLQLFASFGSHPLLLQALAGEIARFRAAPGSYERWAAKNPDFDPFKLELKQAKSHVLKFALQGLNIAELEVLQTVAAFRMPTQYDTLEAVCIGENKACSNTKRLDAVLTQLEDRGLLGWDRVNDRYDLHPVVRGVTWTLASAERQKEAYSALQGYFEAAPKIENYLEVNKVEDLTPAIELYYAVIGLGYYEDAANIFEHSISNALQYRLGTSREQIEMLELFFADGMEFPPRLENDSEVSWLYNSLALAYRSNGELRKATSFYSKANVIDERENKEQLVATGLQNLSDVFYTTGSLKLAFKSVEKALQISLKLEDEYEQAVSLYWLALIQIAIGRNEKGKTTLNESLKLVKSLQDRQGEGVVNILLAEAAILNQNFSDAGKYIEEAWQCAQTSRFEYDYIRSTGRQGQIALALGKLENADERLHHTLSRARAVNFVDEELPALTALAELARRRNQLEKAHEYLNDIWDYAERGPYPLFHSDACTVLSRVEQDAGNLPAAREAAEKAFRLAWCDGPPYAYHYGLTQAREQLQNLSVNEEEITKLEAELRAQTEAKENEEEE